MEGEEMKVVSILVYRVIGYGIAKLCGFYEEKTF